MNNDTPTQDDIQELKRDLADMKSKFELHFHDGNNSQRVNYSDILASPSPTLTIGRDNNNHTGGSTLSYDLIIPTSFVPRFISATGYVSHSSGTYFATTNGSAVYGTDGMSSGMSLLITSLSNIVSSLNYTDKSYVPVAPYWYYASNPLIPTAISGGGTVTSYVNGSGKVSLLADSFTTTGIRTINSWTNNSFYGVSGMTVWKQGNCILSNYDATDRTTLQAYAYVKSWSANQVVITFVSAVGYRLSGNINVIG